MSATMNSDLQYNVYKRAVELSNVENMSQNIITGNTEPSDLMNRVNIFEINAGKINETA